MGVGKLSIANSSATGGVLSSSNWLVLATLIGWGGFWLVNGLDKFR